jgi:hypothetical protein
LGNVGEIDFLADAAEVDAAAAEGDVVVVDDFDDSAWNCETHDAISSYLWG